MIRREIVTGDTVYCADYITDDAEACWINGLVVASIDSGDRVHVEGRIHSHRRDTLRHADEPRYTLEEYDEMRERGARV